MDGQSQASIQLMDSVRSPPFLPSSPSHSHSPTRLPFCLSLSVSPVLPDSAKFRHFGNILKALVNFDKVYLVFGQILNLLWQFFMILGQF